MDLGDVISGAQPGTRRPGAGGALRIVSLVPSLTELLCALDLREALVGRTGFCIHPRELLRDVPKVGGTKNVDVARVRALAPTHLVVNVDENEKPVVDALAAFVPEIVVTHPIEVEDNAALIERFGELFDRRERAAALVAEFRAALHALRRRRFVPMRVVYLIWKDPWMTVGPDTFIARMLAEAGMVALAPGGEPAPRYPTIAPAWMRECGAAAVLLSSEPYRFGIVHAAELARTLAAQPTASDIAAPPPRCFTIDGEMTSWYGSRASAGLLYLLDYRSRLDAVLSGKAHAFEPPETRKPR